MTMTAAPEAPDTAADPAAMRDCLLWIRGCEGGHGRYARRINQVLAGDTDAVLRARIGRDAALTPVQWDVLRAIDAYQRANRGMSPTLQEIADVRGVSKVTVLEHVNALHRKRVIARDRHVSRNIRIVER